MNPPNPMPKNEVGKAPIARKICGYEVHPAAELFPMMPEAELKELAADIKAHGLIHRIVLCDGKVLDGRNRLLGCDKAGIVPYFKNYSGEHSPTEYVLATNRLRRHLTTGQKAAAAANSLPMLEAEAKEKMLKGKASDPDKIIYQGERSPQSIDRAADAVGVNRQYVSDAKRIKEKSPEIFQQIAEGKKTIPEAKKELGWEQPTKTAEDNLEHLMALWRKCTPKEKAEFLNWVQKSGTNQKSRKK